MSSSSGSDNDVDDGSLLEDFSYNEESEEENDDEI